MKFCNLSAKDLVLWHNALSGSNIEPRFKLQKGPEKLLEKSIKLDRLKMINSESDWRVVKELEGVDVPIGACHFNIQLEPEKVYVKAKDSWVYFQTLTVQGYGQVKASKLIKTNF